MFKDMNPSADHRYFLPRHSLAFEAFWPRRGRSWLRGLLGAPSARRQKVSPDELRAAVDLLERQDLEGATVAFTGLGYEVHVRHLPRGA